MTLEQDQERDYKMNIKNITITFKIMWYNFKPVNLKI